MGVTAQIGTDEGDVKAEGGRRTGSESTNNSPFDATNSYKTQLFLATASGFQHAQGLSLTLIIQ